MDINSINSILSLENTEVKLSEVSERDKKWAYFKNPAEQITDIYAESSDYKKYAFRMSKCANILEFKVIEDDSNCSFSFKLKTANFCRVRTCPICQWRRSLMWKARFYEAIPEILEKYPTAKFLFLTLTVKNCDIEKLGETLFEMHYGFRKLAQREDFKKSVIGWIRATEVTKPRSSNTEAHPHYHVLLMVNSNYFSKNYIKQERWVQMWKECCSLDYDPIVDVRRITPSKKKNGIKEGEGEAFSLVGAVAETLKYSAKPADLTADPEWLIKYTQQILRKRFIDSGGALKDILKEKEKETDETMIHLNSIPQEDDKDDELKYRFWWDKSDGDYFNRKPKK